MHSSKVVRAFNHLQTKCFDVSEVFLYSSNIIKTVAKIVKKIPCILIDLMQLTSIPHIPKHEMDSGRKGGYYATNLSGKNDCGLWSASIAEQFASSFLTSTGSDFTFTPRGFNRT